MAATYRITRATDATTTVEGPVAGGLRALTILRAAAAAREGCACACGCDGTITEEGAVVELPGGEECVCDSCADLCDVATGEVREVAAEAEARSIRVTTSAEAGCEWDELDQDAYAAACVAALESAYPGADVEVEVAPLSQGDFRTRAEVSDGIEAHEVLAIVQGVWDDAEFWPARNGEVRS